MSSAFEYAAIGEEYDFPFYKDQNDGIARIVRTLEEIDAPVHLNIRTHPHLKGVRNPDLNWVLDLRSPKVTVIPPASPVSSYALLRACEKTLTFGSTVGLEAVYWGKPSIMAGRSAYQDLGGTYNPCGHEELIEMLLADLPPKPKEAALKYGYHELTRGIEFKHYQPDSYLGGKYKGQYLDQVEPWYWRLIRRVAGDRRIRNTRTYQRLCAWHRYLLRRRLRVPLVQCDLDEKHGA